MKKILLVFSIFFLGNQFVNAQLVAGDVAFIGFHQDNQDGFTFITLTNISAGEVIYFTDHSWSSTDNDWHANTGDAHYSWTVPAGGTPIGTIVNVVETAVADVLTVSSGVIAKEGGGSFSIIQSGDVLIAYQSTAGAQPTVANATFLAAIYTDDNFAHNTGCDGLQGWFNSTGSCASSPSYPANGSNASGIPNGLTDGVNAMHLYPSPFLESGSQNDNGRYFGTLDGDSATILAAINDRTNWEMFDAAGLDITATYYNSNTTVNVTLGLEENILDKETSIYPNPNKGSFALNYSGQEKLVQLEVIDMLGKKVQMISLESFTNSQEVNLTNLAQGMYFITIQSASAKVTKRMIIE